MVNSNSKNLLLDTHILPWTLENTTKLGQGLKNLLLDADTAYVSVVSLWELAMKHKNGKFPYTTKQLELAIETMNISIIDLKPVHIEYYSRVVLPHKDPFDILLVAQSLAEDLSFVTADQKILSSGYKNLIDARS